MSLKNYFEKAESVNALSTVSHRARNRVAKLNLSDITNRTSLFEKRFIPRIDFSKPENFAHYGLAAEEYYQTAMQTNVGIVPVRWISPRKIRVGKCIN